MDSRSASIPPTIRLYRAAATETPLLSCKQPAPRSQSALDHLPAQAGAIFHLSDADQYRRLNDPVWRSWALIGAPLQLVFASLVALTVAGAP
jgi:hypothetical protein